MKTETNTLPTLYVITGPAGVGKTTVSQKLATKLKKSALIEGDEIYHQVISSYERPWKVGNHLDIFWEVCINSIDIYLKNGYDVVFNYIVNPKDILKLHNCFSNYNIKFIILIVDKETLIKRDKERPLDCQMNERCIELLNNFLKKNYDKEKFLDTSNLTIEEISDLIINSNKYLL